MVVVFLSKILHSPSVCWTIELIHRSVSANGALLLAYVNGDLGHWYGSSLAAPIWASTITLINNERHVRGKGILSNIPLFAYHLSFQYIGF